jgi:hypothetical protein
MREIAQKVATRPAATAIKTHHPKPGSSFSHDPAGDTTLDFAAGARIVGITFPEHFGGTRCIGYHDGERGSFPASTIMLESPDKGDVEISAQSTLIAFAKWDFKSTGSEKLGWLVFKKGEKISNIGYKFQDYWCWSGQNMKGRWGLFPAEFVETLQEQPASGSSIIRRSSRLGFGSLSAKLGSLSLKRSKSNKPKESRSSDIVAHEEGSLEASSYF